MTLWCQETLPVILADYAKDEQHPSKHHIAQFRDSGAVGRACVQAYGSTGKQRSGENNRAIYGLVFTMQMQQVMKILSAAKAPKSDGKGNVSVKI